MQYQLINDKNGDLIVDVVKMTDDNGIIWFIPNDPGNKDWKQYQAWLAADPANEPEPAD